MKGRRPDLATQPNSDKKPIQKCKEARFNLKTVVVVATCQIE